MSFLDGLRPSFRASTGTSPAQREQERQALARAMAGVPVDVVKGFEAIKENNRRPFQSE